MKRLLFICLCLIMNGACTPEEPQPSKFKKVKDIKVAGGLEYKQELDSQGYPMTGGWRLKCVIDWSDIAFDYDKTQNGRIQVLIIDMQKKWPEGTRKNPWSGNDEYGVATLGKVNGILVTPYTPMSILVDMENSVFEWEIGFDRKKPDGTLWPRIPGLSSINVQTIARLELKGVSEDIEKFIGVHCSLYVQQSNDRDFTDNAQATITWTGLRDLWYAHVNNAQPPQPPPEPENQMFFEPYLLESETIFERVCPCGEPQTDSDGDTVPDCKDVCPNDPNKEWDEGICGCGLDDTLDTDQDQIADCIDPCPLIPLWDTQPCNQPFDTDGDNDVDMRDFGIYQFCITRWGIQYDPASDCRRFDYNFDLQINDYDLSLFSKCASGPGNPANPNCVWE